MIARLAQPLHSFDPIDWFMYCDLLQDAGASSRRWTFARRVAESLQREPTLVLVLACPASSLQGHWLRVGRNWFVPTEATMIDKYSGGYAWWHRDWARRGLLRYPYLTENYGVRDDNRLLDFAQGTPEKHQHSQFETFRRLWSDKNLRSQFFRGHSLQRVPSVWL